MTTFGGFKLGQYRHWKKGAMYVAYDITRYEGSGHDMVSYVRLSDGSTHSRLLEGFTADVRPERVAENGMGQRQAFKLMDTSVTFAIHNNTKTPSTPPVIENGVMVSGEVLGEQFTTMKEFLEANGIPSVLPIKLGDTVTVWTPLVSDENNMETYTITGINNHGVYVSIPTGYDIFLPWAKLTAITLSFKG